MKKIHILGPKYSSFVRSVWLYCEELNLSYTLGTQIEGKEITLGSKEHSQLHPFKKVPVLIYDGTAIFETTTICRFLDDITNHSLTPQDPLTRALVDEWSGAISSYIDNILVRQYVSEFVFPKGPNKSIREDKITAITPQVIETLIFLDKQLATKPFFCGNFYSMADAILTPILDYVAKTPQAEQLFSDTQQLLPYLSRMTQRPSGKIVFADDDPRI